MSEAFIVAFHATFGVIAAVGVVALVGLFIDALVRLARR